METVGKVDSIASGAREDRAKGYEQRSGYLVSAFRLLALAIVAVEIFLLKNDDYSAFPPVALFIAASLYSLFKIFQPLSWYRTRPLNYIIQGIDVVICAFLVISTNSLYSPYLLYSLSPLFTAALLLDIKVTAVISGLSLVYVLVGYLLNLFRINMLPDLEIGRYLLFFSAVGMITIMPYLINVNFRQRLQREVTLNERQRVLSEIHEAVHKP